MRVNIGGLGKLDGISMKSEFIRNFCIIAHIDHGKSTLADRLLDITGTVNSRELKEQFLDSMDLERERGITIKARAVRILYSHRPEIQYQLNLIDTPGHVDFSYEVSRSLAACEGALLIVDATQGIQAQTLSNMYLALEHNLEIIPVINKIDLPAAEPSRISKELEQAFGFKDTDMLFVSAKTGTGMNTVLEAIVEKIPPPDGDVSKPLQALIFDSMYNSYKGAVAYVRIFQGSLKTRDRIKMMANGITSEVMEVGILNPHPTEINELFAGEVGYIATGLKNVSDCSVGDTVTKEFNGASESLPGYLPLKPMVFAGIYPSDGESFMELREALERLSLNDSALIYENEMSIALGPGFRCGFLGLLHMDVVQERLEREYKLSLLATSPSVSYRVSLIDGNQIEVDNPSKLPMVQDIEQIQEPWLNLKVLTPSRYIGSVMELLNTRRGEYVRMEYLQYATKPNDSTSSIVGSNENRVLIEYEIPLSEVLFDFYDQLKSISQGYASMDYSLAGYRSAPLVRLDILVNEKPIDALSLIIHRDKAYQNGKALVERLKEIIPRQLFEVPIQAAIGSRIIARQTIKALRKNVLAKCYGGDVTRKRKLLEKQAEGKKRMKRVGNVEIPQEAFLSILKVSR